MLDDPFHVTDPDDEPMDDRLDEVFALARSQGTAEELSCERDIVGAMSAIIAQLQTVPALDLRRRRGASKVGARAGIVVSGLLLLGTSTAAATGNLPDAAQSAVAQVTSHVGIDLADPDQDARSTTAPIATQSSVAPTSTQTIVSSVAETIPQPLSAIPPQPPPVFSTEATTSAEASPHVAGSAGADPPTTHALGPGPDDPAMKGLCQAWASHGHGGPAEQRSTVTVHLELAAAAAGQTVEQLCAPVVAISVAAASETTGVDSGVGDTPADRGRKMGHDDKVDHDATNDNNPKNDNNARDDKPKDDD